MAPNRQILSETTRALMVLALLFFGLSLGPAASAGPVGGSPAVAALIAQTAASDYCGSGWGDKQTAHAPCHACRSSVAALPPPPCVVEPAFLDVAPVTYLGPVAAISMRPLYEQSRSRAPPLV